MELLIGRSFFPYTLTYLVHQRAIIRFIFIYITFHFQHHLIKLICKTNVEDCERKKHCPSKMCTTNTTAKRKKTTENKKQLKCISQSVYMYLCVVKWFENVRLQKDQSQKVTAGFLPQMVVEKLCWRIEEEIMARKIGPSIYGDLSKEEKERERERARAMFAS